MLHFFQALEKPRGPVVKKDSDRFEGLLSAAVFVVGWCHGQLLWWAQHCRPPLVPARAGLAGNWAGGTERCQAEDAPQGAVATEQRGQSTGRNQ